MGDLCPLASHLSKFCCHLSVVSASLYAFIPLFLLERVLVFYCCITSDHKLIGLKQHPLISSGFCRSEKYRLCFFLEAVRKDYFQVRSVCWLNLVPCSCRTVVLVSSLAVSPGLLSVLEATCICKAAVENFSHAKPPPPCCKSQTSLVFDL